jgi:hypothetical protein
MEGGRENMEKQEEGARERAQDVEAFMRRLPGLVTERCPCPYVNMARAIYNREQVIKALWPEYVDDARAVEALGVVISCLDLASWWCQRRRSMATMHIRQFVIRLLVCRQAAEKREGEDSS